MNVEVGRNTDAKAEFQPLALFILLSGVGRAHVLLLHPYSKSSQQLASCILNGLQALGHQLSPLLTIKLIKGR